jgi:hypothetical protein
MKIKFLFAVIVSMTAMSFIMIDQNRPWELLGARKIDYKVDRDEILVTQPDQYAQTGCSLW